jgi:hypothetical protein
VFRSPNATIVSFGFMVCLENLARSLIDGIFAGAGELGAVGTPLRPVTDAE